MTFFYQYQNNKQYNKIIDGDIPSGYGYSAIPYTFGNFNKLSPKPFGLPIPAQLYSLYADTGFRQERNNANLSNRDIYGPVNYIYEVDISGITNTGDESGVGRKCLSCNYLNKRYYFYRTGSDSVDHNSLFIPGQISNTVNYSTEICNSNSIYQLCGFNTPELSIGLVEDNSGIGYMLTFIQTAGPFGNANLGLIRNTITAGTQTFRKVVDYFPLGVSTTNPNLNERKLKPLETEIALPYYTGIEQTYSLSGINGYTSSSGDFNCNFNNALVLIRPYKNAFYDIFNISSYFATESSGWPDSFSNDGYNTGPVDTARYFSPCEGFSVSGIEYLNAIGGNSQSHLVTSLAGKFPPVLELRFNDVENISNLSNCISCNEFFNFPFILNYGTGPLDGIITPPSGNPGTYSYYYHWAGYGSYAQYSNYSTDYNFFNICDLGCTTSRVSGSGNGPCFNLIELALFGSGLFITTGRWDAVLGFFGVNSNGTYRSNHTFVKNICDMANSGVPCNSGLGVLRRGLFDCLSNDFWSSGWIYQPTYHNGNTPSPANIDVTEYCEFSNANISIVPRHAQSFPCAEPRCYACDNQVPRSANVTLEISLGGNTIYNNDFVLSLDMNPLNNFVLATSRCAWEYNDITNSGERVQLVAGPRDDITMSGVYLSLAVEFGQPFIFSSIPSGICDDITQATVLPNTGPGIANWQFNCNSIFNLTGPSVTIGSGSLSQGLHCIGGTLEATVTATVELTDFVPVLDYL